MDVAKLLFPNDLRALKDFVMWMMDQSLLVDMSDTKEQRIAAYLSCHPCMNDEVVRMTRGWEPCRALDIIVMQAVQFGNDDLVKLMIWDPNRVLENDVSLYGRDVMTGWRWVNQC